MRKYHWIFYLIPGKEPIQPPQNTSTETQKTHKTPFSMKRWSMPMLCLLGFISLHNSITYVLKLGRLKDRWYHFTICIIWMLNVSEFHSRFLKNMVGRVSWWRQMASDTWWLPFMMHIPLLFYILKFKLYELIWKFSFQNVLMGLKISWITSDNKTNLTFK